MNKKIISIGTSRLLIYCSCVPMLHAKAETIDTKASYAIDIEDRTVGLISQYGCSISNSYGNISLTAWTYSSNTMSSIGLKNISVQRSSNGVNWTEETPLNDKLKSNSKKYNLTDFIIPVQGGFYYRIVCDHYADNGSGITQTISNTSNSIWIS